MKGIAGARILVSGASRGIGLGVAEAFVAAGAEVWTLAEDEAVAEAARRIGATGIRADVTDPEAVATALDGLPTDRRAGEQCGARAPDPGR